MYGAIFYYTIKQAIGMAPNPLERNRGDEQHIPHPQVFQKTIIIINLVHS